MKDQDKAYALAKEAFELAYAPYSKFQVGACFKLKGQDQYVTGCNIENGSFGATVCAERVAIFNSISQFSVMDFELLALVTKTPASNPAMPCGMCLQVMSEFCEPDMPVYIGNLDGIQQELKFKDLLPKVFKL